MKSHKETLGIGHRTFSILTLLLAPCASLGEGLELGLEDPNKVVSNETLYPHAHLALYLFGAYLCVGLLLLAYAFAKHKGNWRPPVFLSQFPVSAKIAVSLAMISYAFVHILALLEIYFVTTVTFKSASEYFQAMTISKLAATSHAHLFGHGTMYLITSLIFVLSRMREGRKIIFISLALVAGLLDVPSWWAIKYGGPQYEIFSSAAGLMSVVGWGFMATRIVGEMWWFNPSGGET